MASPNLPLPLSLSAEPLNRMPQGTQGVAAARGRLQQRWDGEDVLLFRGRYGDYLKKKISKVFPALFASTVQAEQQQHAENAAAAPAAASDTAKAGEDFVVDYHPDSAGDAGAKAVKEKAAQEAVFEWTALLHKQQGPLSDEEQSEEHALLERMRQWNEKNL